MGGGGQDALLARGCYWSSPSTTAELLCGRSFERSSHESATFRGGGGRSCGRMARLATSQGLLHLFPIATLLFDLPTAPWLLGERSRYHYTNHHCCTQSYTKYELLHKFQTTTQITTKWGKGGETGLLQAFAFLGTHTTAVFARKRNLALAVLYAPLSQNSLLLSGKYGT